MKQIKSILSLLGFGAITTVAATFLGNIGSYLSGEIIAFGGNDTRDLAYKGTATFTGDGATTTATCNYIDGTATIPFTPSAILIARVGGNDTAAGVPWSAVVDNKTFTVNWTVAIANTKTQQIMFWALK